MHAFCRVLIASVALLLALSQEAKSDESDIGIVLMHGKWAGPPAPPIQGLTTQLRAKGFKVITPVMPWGQKRMYNADYPTALSEIEASVEVLRKNGAKRIIVAGQSFGANASIAYAASGRKVDGVMAIAPGHAPDLQNFGASVAKARQMMAEGKGEETVSFDDNNQGQNRIVTTTAKIYLSYFDPDGLGAMPRSAAAIPKPVPFLWVVGTHDLMYSKGKDYVFNKVPKHPQNTYLVVNADHSTTPVVAASQIVEWIMSLKD
jgi:dienelactone hydrolase